MSENGSMPDRLPTFRTQRLTVRLRAMSDLEACMAMDREPEVTRFLPGPWADPVAHRAFVEGRMCHAYPVGMGYWSIVAPEGFVGWVLLTPLDLHGPEIEIGWRLVRAAWGPRLCDGSCNTGTLPRAQDPGATGGDRRHRSGEHRIGRRGAQTRLPAGGRGPIQWPRGHAIRRGPGWVAERSALAIECSDSSMSFTNRLLGVLAVPGLTLAMNE
jgi:hypothetical protein